MAPLSQMAPKLRALSEGLAPLAPGKKVWKDECGFSFLTPESARDGLFLNLRSLQAFSSLFLDLDHARTRNELYMYVKWSREAPQEPVRAETTEDPTRLAIGVEGGFSPPDAIGGAGTLVKEYGFVVYPDLDTIWPYPSPRELAQVPRALAELADAVIASDDASHATEVQAWDAAAEPRPVSKFADKLPQPSTAVRISPDPAKWRCADSGLTENLWLNLSTGHIGSGRRNYDGTGGTGAALKHYEATGKKYPLCVKLGTITAGGDAEVYSYDASEDCLVTDPKLAQHLKHLGIDMAAMRKTERTMLELEIDLNKSLSFAAVLENGEELVNCYGPGKVGLYNLGNSCYCNSVLQLLMALVPFQRAFFAGQGKDAARARDAAFRAAPSEPQTDLRTQLVKLAAALSDPAGSGVDPVGGDGDDADTLAVAPRMLKDVLGKGHPDFAGREQQDAREYFEHVLDRLARMHRAQSGDAGRDPGWWFSFLTESRLLCRQSDKVKYRTGSGNVLMLQIPLEADEQQHDHKQRDKDDEEKEELPEVAFMDCVRASLGASAAERVEDYLSPATKRRGVAVKTPALATFPELLAVQLKRYVVGDDWVPRKLECRVPVPRQLDLTPFRAKGLQDDEDELPDDDASSSSNNNQQQQQQQQADPAMLAELQSMGFSENGCRRALRAVENASADAAASWIFAHMDDADFNAPLADAHSSGGAGAPDPEAVGLLAGMGFPESAAELALRECGGNVERAADWLFSHAGELEALVAAGASGGGGAAGSGGARAEEELREENDASRGKYVLRGFVSHLGKTTTGGHYLCHVNLSRDLSDARKDDWVIFNDRKVAQSKKPPFDHGFLYVFERQ